jgi:hypothetical protein
MDNFIAAEMRDEPGHECVGAYGILAHLHLVDTARQKVS